MAKYIVSGMIRKKTKFNLEVEAKSEKHASQLAVTKVGSAQGIKSTAIRIAHVKAVK